MIVWMLYMLIWVFCLFFTLLYYKMYVNPLWQIIPVYGVNVVNGCFARSLKVNTFLAASFTLGKSTRFMFEAGKETDLKNWVAPALKYQNAQIHKYKYTNTVWVKFADTPNMCYIFEKVMVRGPQKQCSWVFITI